MRHFEGFFLIGPRPFLLHSGQFSGQKARVSLKLPHYICFAHEKNNHICSESEVLYIGNFMSLYESGKCVM
jgi:hypothetical protein